VLLRKKRKGTLSVSISTVPKGKRGVSKSSSGSVIKNCGRGMKSKRVLSVQETNLVSREALGKKGGESKTWHGSLLLSRWGRERG